jgi:hypothetical protein
MIDSMFSNDFDLFMFALKNERLTPVRANKKRSSFIDVGIQVSGSTAKPLLNGMQKITRERF